MRELTLTEYQEMAGVKLSPEQRDGILEVAPSVSVTPSLGQEGYYDLTPGSHVGAINLPDLAVQIRPKIPLERVLFLFSYALDPHKWVDDLSSFAKEPSLVEAVIPGFVAQVRRAFRRGVLQGYRTEEAALPTVRGRLRFDEQIRERFGLLPPAEVRYDEFTEDIQVNRLIKAAIRRLARLRIRSEVARRSLRAFDVLLVNVANVEYDPRRLPEVRFDRLNIHYRPAVALARLILRSTSFELSHGQVRAASFLVDMNEVFEDFLVVALREALRLSQREFPQGASGRRLLLDEAGEVRLEPDLSWWAGPACTFVGDVNYKRASATAGQNADLYQLLAYTIAAGVPGGLLIYAAGEADRITHRVAPAGKELRVRSLDLQGQPEEILAQVKELSWEVIELRNSAPAAHGESPRFPCQSPRRMK
jgi:5-methylcytosine-specific restriction enzyme subunit McrC